MKVLVVDDQEAVRTALQVLLEVHDIECALAANAADAIHLVKTDDIGVVVQDMNFSKDTTTGEEGVRLALASLPDLVLMDLQLPGIDGTEALRQIQQQAGERMMPVVAVTASAMPSDREAAARAGFDGFLEKPINVRALPAQVASYLTGSP